MQTVGDSAAPSTRWLFSPVSDTLVFLGSSLFSLLVVLLVPRSDTLGETPPWAWLMFVLCIDVAHVWSTLYRVYLDPEEVRRRPVLYAGAPIVALTLGILAHSVSSEFFWRCLAYVAVWHFIRQQMGFMTLYGRRGGASANQLRFDSLAILAATLGPIVWWHAHLPLSFWWFHEGDFIAGLTPGIGQVALVLDAVISVLWLGNEVRRLLRREANAGKLLLLLATQLTWFGGIVVVHDDFAFTVMNVVLHGVPYLFLVSRYTKHRARESGYGRWTALIRLGFPVFMTSLLMLAWVEEFAWDRLVWHEHPMFFGGSTGLQLTDVLLILVVPLLSLPQTTHYLLDGFIWKSKANPFLSARLGWSSAPK